MIKKKRLYALNEYALLEYKNRNKHYWLQDGGNIYIKKEY